MSTALISSKTVKDPDFHKSITTSSSTYNAVINNSISPFVSTYDKIIPKENNTGAAHKKRRGETRGLELTKKKRPGHQIDIDIPEHVRRAVGVNCQSYITNIGCIVRQNVPLQVKSWNEIDRTNVTYLLRRVREKFKLGNEPHVDEAIEEDMKRRYTTWRYNLHKKFLQYKSVEEAHENRPENVGEDDWNYLINWWQDDEFLDLSEKNKKNRDKLAITHCAGTKAFSRIRYENQNPENGEEPSRIDMFKLTRFSKKKTSWVGDVTENAFDEMTKLKNPSHTNEESVEAMSDDEIYDQIISTIVGPPRSGYIRGLGADELETVKASAAQQNEELEAVKVSAAQQSEELKAVKAKQNETDALLKKLMAQLTSRK
ncbi:hypothetical protein M0R45_002132 [Rubus argutus]|uniref:Transposase, Ptta/En/Spm, plant n=1 Tax=Rubus argutus TaxID=59490 RepID=A0AAW1VH81_RUBAR